MIEKPADSQTSKDHCMAMVSSKVLKQLSILEQRKFDDEDIVADIEFLNERLQASVQDLRWLILKFSLLYKKADMNEYYIVYLHTYIYTYIYALFSAHSMNMPLKWSLGALNGVLCTDLPNFGGRMLVDLTRKIMSYFVFWPTFFRTVMKPLC